MGKRFNKKRKRQSNDGNSKVEKPKRERSEQIGYVEAVKENKDFETYYKLQELVPEEEWDDFLNSLKNSLPASFRITGNKSEAKALNKILVDDFFKPLSELTPEASKKTIRIGDDGEIIEDEPIKPLQPKALQWYPTGMAYQLNLSRKDIRRCEAYWQLHQCLITETETGNISRQEAVSMIPPLLMDIQPHHKVLDMCAAPGSKTAQLIEQLHSSSDGVKGAIPPGVVVANDADNKRCYLLTHQAKRLQSPCTIITNHDASFMPNIFYTKEDGSSGKLKFDRILCDVPCSGDGTVRKNVDVWGKWNPVNGSNLHGLQLRIARRGLEMLAVGGRMVYSTCSLSPMENEAVIQRLLLETEGAVKLVDCSQHLPGLKVRAGLTKWKVVTKEMQTIDSPQEIPTKLSNVYHKHLFPANKPELNLDRCLRLLPHHQDTGAFFVAALEKVGPLPGEKVEEPSPAPPGGCVGTNTQRIKPPPRKKSRRQGYKEEPFFFLSDSIEKLKTGESSPDGETKKTSETEKVATSEGITGVPSESVTETEKTTSEEEASNEQQTAQDDLKLWESISSFFGISKSIPEADVSNFMTRSKDRKTRNIYITNALVKDIVARNEDRVKIINTGVKILVRVDNKGATCDFRLAQEGVQSVIPLITKRKINVSRSDMVTLLTNEDSDAPPEIECMAEETKAQGEGMSTGSVLLEYKGDPTVADDMQHTVREQDKILIHMVGWKGRTTMRGYVARVERVHYLRLIRADTSKYLKNKFTATSEKQVEEKKEVDEKENGVDEKENDVETMEL